MEEIFDYTYASQVDSDDLLKDPEVTKIDFYTNSEKYHEEEVYGILGRVANELGGSGFVEYASEEGDDAFWRIHFSKEGVFEVSGERVFPGEVYLDGKLEQVSHPDADLALLVEVINSLIESNQLALTQEAFDSLAKTFKGEK